MNQKSQEYQGNLSNQSAVEKFRTVRGSFTKPVELDQYQLKVGAEFIELTLTLMVSVPLKVVAQKFGMISEQEVVLLKDSVRDIILNSNRQWQLSYFQESLQSRSDITLEMLLKSHRTQLEILLAIKTGLQDFLQCNSDISSSNLGEIFLNVRCRNLVCRSLLPVDECNCRFCILNTGFCSACMCLICSKFDTSCNTCSWVGCDLCSHWYHAQCALQESCIRNGRSFGGAESKTGMHLHCIACGRVSELFDFVKDIFIECLEDWTAEDVLRELNYVKEIFLPSEDFRGKRLHEIAIQLLSNLGNNVDVEEANHILGFLTAPDSFIEDDVQVDYFTEKYDIEGQKVKKMQLMEHKGMMKVFDKDEAKINQASFLLSSPSETETALLLERAKMLLQRNNERNLQCLGLGYSMKVYDEDKARNNRICFSSSSSSSVCNYRKRKPL